MLTLAIIYRPVKPEDLEPYFLSWASLCDGTILTNAKTFTQ